MTIRVSIDGSLVPQSELDEAELARSRAAAQVLARRFGKPKAQQLLRAGETDLARIRGALTDARLELGPAHMKDRLQRAFAVSDAGAKLSGRLAAGRRRLSIVEIACDHGSAADTFNKVREMFTVASDRNRMLGLYAAPHHYVLEPAGPDLQDIVESFGGSPVLSNFLVHYGDDASLRFPRDRSYPLHMSGAVKTRDGVAIGGVRHQYRDEGDGFRIKVADEIPLLFPKSMVGVHQRSIAAEFTIWIRELVG